MIAFSETFKNFLWENKEKSKVINSLFWYTERSYRVKSYSLMINEDDINYITFRDNGNISYLPKGKTQLFNEDGTWKRDGRQEGKPAKVIRKLFTDKAVKLFKDSDLDAFNNIYKSHFNSNLKIELLDRFQVKNVYDMSRKSGGGSLNSSCMNGDTDYLDIYENCEKLQILILKDENGYLCGRALVWSLDEGIFMDRIYVCDDYMTQIFFDYATKNGWNRKYEQSYSNKKRWVSPIGEIFTKTLRIDTPTTFEQYPYIDTFSFGDDGFLCNEDDYTYTYNCTDGKREGEEENHDNEMYDEITDEYIDSDDAICIDIGTYRGRCTHVDNTVEDYRGHIWWNEDEGIICLSNGKYCDTDDATYCEYYEEYYLSDNVVMVERGEYSDQYIHEDLVCTIDGETWYKDDDSVEYVNGEYRLIEEEIEELVN